MLTPTLIRQLDKAAIDNGDDRFFAIMSEGQSWFVFNWVFGLSFKLTEVMNCPHFDRLRDRADTIADQSADRAEVLQHLSRRSWLDMLVGTGLYMSTECVDLMDEEAELLRGHDMIVTAFTTEQGRRYYVKDNYLDIANEVIGADFEPCIFRPINSASTPEYYRPMIFFDVDKLPRGICYAIQEENLQNPIDRSLEVQQRVERSMPELFGDIT
jgi:hypothetical protein